jgi:hypothetical protein
MQMSYRVEINAGWFAVEELQSKIANDFETVMGNDCMNVVEERLGHRRDGEEGSGTQNLCLILLV